MYVCQSACILSSWPKLSSRYHCRSGICVAFDLFGVILYIWFSTPECPCVKQHSLCHVSATSIRSFRPSLVSLSQSACVRPLVYSYPHPQRSVHVVFEQLRFRPSCLSVCLFICVRVSVSIKLLLPRKYTAVGSANWFTEKQGSGTIPGADRIDCRPCLMSILIRSDASWSQLLRLWHATVRGVRR